MDLSKITITITYGDMAENHAGMQQIGTKLGSGFSVEYLEKVKNNLLEAGANAELINLDVDGLGYEAAILVWRNALEYMNTGLADLFFMEQLLLNWDMKAKMRGKVVNKIARHNLCYWNQSQEPNYEAGAGRIISFAEVPYLNCVREYLMKFLGLTDLVAEGNKYWDVTKTYIGFHGDGERRVVIGVRLGADFPLHYQWFHQNKPISQRITINLKHGDLYIMSDKAVGWDWKRSSAITLRHAAGFEAVLRRNKAKHF